MNPGTAEESPDDVLERRYRIHGRVQGVGFRWWTRVQATRLGVSGDVRNLPDGTVEVRARGRAPQLQRLASLLAEGAPASHVSRVDQADIRGVPAEGFDIAH